MIITLKEKRELLHFMMDLYLDRKDMSISVETLPMFQHEMNELMNHDNDVTDGNEPYEVYEREQTAKKFNDVLNKHGITKR